MTPADTLDKAKVGDVVDGPQLLKFMAATLEAKVIRKADTGVVGFELSFMGIPISKVVGKVTPSGKPSWVEDK
jgi:hypothetical protein